MPELIKATADAGNVLVPGQGWFIYGGNTMDTAQKLSALGEIWSVGPSVYQGTTNGQCIVQVRNYFTVS
jgi:hypothetical protein